MATQVEPSLRSKEEKGKENDSTSRKEPTMYTNLGVSSLDANIKRSEPLRLDH